MAIDAEPGRVVGTMSIEVRRVDAFTRDEAGGNPAGVVLSAETLGSDTMQAIAAKLGYSETAFLTARNARDYQVRFFAPKKEVAICGHATVALFHVLAETTGLLGATRMQCGVGSLGVAVEEDGRVFLAQKTPEVGEGAAKSRLATALGIPESDLTEPLDAHRVASTGLRKIFTRVVSREVLNALNPKREAVEALSQSYGAIGVYVYTAAPALDPADYYCRNYAPVVGIWDDAATGTSAAALTGVLRETSDGAVESLRTVFFQGDPVGLPSRIETQWRGDELWVGGHATTVDQFDLELSTL